MNKCKAIGLLNDAKDNVLDLLDDIPDSDVQRILSKELLDVEKAIDNPTAFAMDILRHEMKDKSEGGLYHAWLCNIKWAVIDSIKSQPPLYKSQDSWLQNGSEEGAKLFLDRLLKDD